MVKTIEVEGIPYKPEPPAHWARNEIEVGDLFRYQGIILRAVKIYSHKGKMAARLEERMSTGTWVTRGNYYFDTIFGYFRGIERVVSDGQGNPG